MEQQIINAFLCRDKRAIGNIIHDLKLSKEIVNRLYQKESILVINNIQLMSVLGLFCQEEILQSIDKYYLFEENIDYTGDILFLIAILVDVFNIDKRQHINSRLKYFAFRMMLSFNLNEVGIDQYLTLQNFLFSKFLYSHPVNDDYRLLFSIELSSHGNRWCCYRKQVVDIKKIFNTYVEGLFNTPKIADKLNSRHIEGNIINSISYFVNCLLDNLVGDKFNMQFPGLNSNNDTLNKVFNNEQHILSTFIDQQKFIETLRFSMKNYRLMPWDENDDSTVSMYYGPKKNELIEEQFLKFNSFNVIDKYLSEYFIDTAIVFILRNPNNLEQIIKELQEEEIRYLLAILFSHPFFDYNARKALSQDYCLLKLLPDGFWSNKIMLGLIP